MILLIFIENWQFVEEVKGPHERASRVAGLAIADLVF
jgi:hypothetical protein